jgi:uncharacterized membrane protein HdeD (DUF308 family)
VLHPTFRQAQYGAETRWPETATIVSGPAQGQAAAVPLARHSITHDGQPRSSRSISTKEDDAMRRIAKAIADEWWLFTLEGMMAIAFGVAAWVWPDLTIDTLVLLFGAFAVAAGGINLVAAVEARRLQESPWGYLFQSLLNLGVGVAVFLWPDISERALLYVIAAWAIVIGTFEIAAAIELRKLINNEWFLALAGIASIAFGVLVSLFPGDGAVALVWTIGVYSIVFGVMLIALGRRLRGFGRDLAATAS